ncbi:MAG TPA: hypothetical protein VJI73_02145 [Candidatus Paceibacterota bacterium]
MDIISHGLWAVAAGKGAQVESMNRLNLRWVFFWGMFPDLFAFLPTFIIRAFSWFMGGRFFNQPPNMYEPWTPGFETLSNFTQLLYQLSHSLFAFLFVALLILFTYKRVLWIMLGWPLHILADIPTHSSIFYQTPAFWPLFNWKFDGFQWGVGHFTLYNYIALVGTFALLYAVTIWRRKKLA